MQAIAHPALDSVSLDRAFHALGDPARLTILRKLAADEGLNCGQICDVLPRSTLSHHMRILREAGLIWTDRKGKTMVSRLRRDEVEARFPGLMDVLIKAA